MYDGTCRNQISQREVINELLMFIKELSGGFLIAVKLESQFYIIPANLGQ